jgi:hypothetical protein
MKAKQALTKNFAIPVIDEAIGLIPESATKLQIRGAWLAAKVAYGLLSDLLPEESKEFAQKIHDNVLIIGKELVKSKEFQQSLVTSFETLLRTRDRRKREIIKTIYLNGYINNKDREQIVLERFYRVCQEISLDSLQHLLFTDKVVTPMKITAAHKKVEEMNKENREHDDDWWFNHFMNLEPDSQYITKWVYDEFDPNSKIVQERIPDVNTDKKKISDQGEKEGKQSKKFAEYASELISLGIFKQKIITYGGSIDYSFTDFGKDFLEYVKATSLEMDTLS